MQKIYLAPIQGFTDFVYRKAYFNVFGEVDKYFIPYISIKNNQLIKKYRKEIHPDNNPQKNTIPQVLAKDEVEFLFLAKMVKNLGYKEINLNLGCPYPMITNRGKGAGLLPQPDKISAILESYFNNVNLGLSVKLRAGLNSEEEIKKTTEVFNNYPLTEVILHPRIARQIYSGEIIDSAFLYAQQNLKHKLVYNGDICSTKDLEERKQIFPETTHWMIGRGILMNPFLPEEIKGIKISKDTRTEKLKNFHQVILEGYMKVMDNEGNVLNKMKQFWSYFCFNFPESRKTFKAIKKSNRLDHFLTCSNKMLLDLY